MGSYLKIRSGHYYARFQVPRDIRSAFGKSEEWVSLGTAIARDARLRALVALDHFRARVRAARNQETGADAEALAFLTRLQLAERREKASGDDFLIHDVVDEILDSAERRFVAPSERIDLQNEFNRCQDRRRAIEAIGGEPAKRYLKTAFGESILLQPLVSEWRQSYALGVEAKTADMAVSTVEKFVSEFPTAERVTRKAVNEWIQRLLEAGVAPATITRQLTSIRRFWKWLQDREYVDGERHPFDGLEVAQRAKESTNGKNGRGYVPFEDQEVTTLYQTAIDDGDTALAQLIALAAYTGARLEELCALKVADVSDKAFRIADSKTKAGIREVPIHSSLKGVVKRLCQKSTDGYLLSGLNTKGKYGKRSNGIGKRFGRLKTKLGFSDRHVFHSIRKTVTTQLERAYVPENVTADIVGHEKPRITYGTYSGGTSFEQRQKAIGKLRYPGLEVKVE